MTFARIMSNNWLAIADAESERRLRAPRPDLRQLTAEQRAEALIRMREDPHEWAAIVAWCRWWDGDRKAPRPTLEDEAEHLARVTLRTAAAALKRWHADGKPRDEAGIEAEARAFKLFYLARRFAAYAGHPTPSVGPDGAIIFPYAERKAA